MTQPIPPATVLPPVVREQLEAPPPPPRSWVWTIAPAFLGVFAWFPLLDALGGIEPRAGVLGRWLPCLLALGACYILVYLPLATLGLRTRGRLPVVAAEALGARGAEWIAGVLHGLFAALWGSVAIWYSVRMTLDGLSAWGLLDHRGAPLVVMGATLESPLALAALAWWAFIIVAANGLNLMGVIAALMRVYAPFAATLLVAASAWAWWGGGTKTSYIYSFAGSGRDPAPAVFQYVFGAFAFAGVMAVEWGAATRDRRDARLGGWTGILATGAATTLAALALGVHDPSGTAWASLIDWPDRWTGGALLILLGLASLAPACYASSLFASRFRAHWPGLGKWKGVGLSYLLFVAPGATGVAGDVATLAAISGAMFAPLAGVLAVEAFRRDRREIAPGWRAPGAVAWAAGAVAGLAPVVAPGLGWFQPAALIGWGVAAAVHAASSRPWAARPA